MLFQRLLIAAVVVVTAVPLALSAEPAAKPEVVRLTITPAMKPVPALKYQLLPTFLERRPGNAALDYGRAIASQSQLRREDAEFETEWNKWLDLSPDEFEKTIKGRDLSALREAGRLEIVRLGARCPTCDWQIPLRDEPFYMILLPHLQEMRRLGKLVALNVRLDVVDGRYDKAVEGLKVGYAMARHTAEEPTLVSGLVGVAIAATMDRARLDLLQRPGAPSLYWAEAFLPRPLIDVRPGLEGEMYALALSFPALRDEERTPEQWNADAHKLLTELPALLTMASDDSGTVKQWMPMLTMVYAMTKVALRRDELRAFLVECGTEMQKVEKMNDAQLLLVFTRLKYDQLRDDLFRWLLLPYAEARPGLERAEQGLRNAKANSEEIVPLAAMILPAISKLRHTYARADRRRDFLRIVEALRLHIGKHDGKLPKSLADLTDVPVPTLDMVTGKPLDYVLDGETVRLTLPDENAATGSPLVYEISVAK